MDDYLERPSDLKLAALLLPAVILITAVFAGFFWLFGDGPAGSGWIGVVVAWAMGLWYWFRNRQMRKEDEKALRNEQL